MPIACYIDNAEKLWDTEVNGVAVKSPEVLRGMSDIKMLISSPKFDGEMTLQLEDMGLKKGEDFYSHKMWFGWLLKQVYSKTLGSNFK